MQLSLREIGAARPPLRPPAPENHPAALCRFRGPYLRIRSADPPRTDAGRRAKIGRDFPPLEIFPNSAPLAPKIAAETLENSPRENSTYDFFLTIAETRSRVPRVRRPNPRFFRQFIFRQIASASGRIVGRLFRPRIRTPRGRFTLGTTHFAEIHRRKPPNRPPKKTRPREFAFSAPNISRRRR